MFKSLLGLLLVFVFCIACSEPPPPPPPPQPSAPDTQSPELKLSGLSSRVLTTSSTVLEGTLALDVTSFVYRLNEGEPKDLLPSVKEGAFKVTVEGLVPGSNTLVLEATDAAGNKTVSEPLTLEVVNATGRWGSHKAEYLVCNAKIPTVFVVNLTASPEGFTGLLTTGYGADYKVSTVTGRFDESGLLESSVRFPPEFAGEPNILGTVRLQLGDTDLSAQLVYNDGQRCSANDETPVDVVVQGDLLRGVDVPPLPADDTLEPNNDKTSARRLALPYRNAALTLVRKNVDWFRLEVKTPSVITVSLGTTQRGAGATVKLYNAAGVVGEPFFPAYQVAPKPPDGASWGVEAGEYFLEIAGFPHPLEAAMPYTLSVSAVATPDATSEPNNTPATATRISVPFCKTLYLTEKDVDWFRFSLTGTTNVSFTTWLVGATSLYDSNLKLLSSDADFIDLAPLPRGDYYVQVKASENAVGTLEYTLGLNKECLPRSRVGFQ
jgi:hypothetical protein